MIGLNSVIFSFARRSNLLKFLENILKLFMFVYYIKVDVTKLQCKVTKPVAIRLQ